MDNLTSYKKAFPLDFQIFDNDFQNVLYMEEGAGQVVTVVIENTSGEILRFADGSHHLAMVFRKGTLASSCLKDPKLIKTDEGKFSVSTESKVDYDVLYLQWKNTSETIPVGEQIEIKLYNIIVDGKQGARGTRIIFETKNIYINDPKSLISTTNEIAISIVNHRGKKNIPLEFSFSGKDTILNDGKTGNTIELYMSNLAVFKEYQSTVTFLKDSDITKSSKLILSFVYSENSANWALGTRKNIGRISVKSDHWKIAKNESEDKDPEWILTPRKTFHLKGKNSGERNHISIELSNIVTDFEAGHTALNIRYENIPSYWDGQTQLILKKQALQFYTGDNNVGIGTNTPRAALEVKGDVMADSFLLGRGEWILDGEGMEYSGQYRPGFSHPWLYVTDKSGITFTNLITEEVINYKMENKDQSDFMCSFYNSCFLMCKSGYSDNEKVSPLYWGKISNGKIQLYQILNRSLIYSIALNKDYGVFSEKSGTQMAVYYFSWSEDDSFNPDNLNMQPLRAFDFNVETNQVMESDTYKMPILNFGSWVTINKSWIFIREHSRIFIFRYNDNNWLAHQVIEAKANIIFDGFVGNDNIFLYTDYTTNNSTLLYLEGNYWKEYHRNPLNTKRTVSCPAISENQLFIGSKQDIDIFNFNKDLCDSSGSIDLSFLNRKVRAAFNIYRIYAFDQSLVVILEERFNKFYVLKLKKVQTHLGIDRNNSITISSPAATTAPPVTIQANKQGQFLRLQLNADTWWDLGVDGNSQQLMIKDKNGAPVNTLPIISNNLQ